MTEADYPYKGEMKIFSPSCKSDKAKGVVTVTDYKKIQTNDGDCIKDAMGTAPVVVSVDSSSTWHFKLYKFGIIRSTECGTNVDHSLLVTGYGSEDGTIEYFELKNSWGSKWGVDGYAKIEIKYGEEGICGLNKAPIQVTTN